MLRAVKKYRYKKSFRTKKKRQILKNKFFWLVFLALIVLGGILYLFLFSSVFQIKEIQVSGIERDSLKKIPPEEIKGIILKDANNIFLLNFESLSKIILEKYPKIANINFKKKLPNSLMIQIKERRPVILLLRKGDYFFVDKEGVPFEKILGIPPEMLVVKIEKPNSSLPIDQMDQILKIKSNQIVAIKEILLVSNSRFNAKTQEGWEIYFNPKENLDWQLTELALVLKQKIPPDERKNLEYIDLRFNKVYIKKSN